MIKDKKGPMAIIPAFPGSYKEEEGLYRLPPEDLPFPDPYNDKSEPWSIVYNEWKRVERYIPKYFY